jgi:hypothetical protein
MKQGNAQMPRVEISDIPLPGAGNVGTVSERCQGFGVMPFSLLEWWTTPAGLPGKFRKLLVA